MKCKSSDINNLSDQHPLLKPTIDVVFKMTFGAPEMEASRNALLNAILRPASKIIHSEVNNPEIPKRIVDDKGVVLDLLVKLTNGTIVNIEMQLSDPASTWSRAPFYWARIYADQLLRGGKHRELKPTIVIFLVNYTQFKNLPDQSRDSDAPTWLLGSTPIQPRIPRYPAIRSKFRGVVGVDASSCSVYTIGNIEVFCRGS